MNILKSYLIVICIFCLPAWGAINGTVEKSGFGQGNQVVDSQSGRPISSANVSLPSKGLRTKTDAQGRFELGAKVNAPTIMSVDKEGYKPFSLTVDDSTLSKPIVIGIEKTNPHDIVIDKDMYHIGDDNYSENSANAGEFRVKAIGPFYTKNFPIKQCPPNQQLYLVLGSVIGIDTKMARDMGQSKVTTAYASPPEIYFNGNKIAELQLNGDNQQIKLPKNLVKYNQNNQITLKCGVNLFQMAYIDYDDIEFMNLYIESH